MTTEASGSAPTAAAQIEQLRRKAGIDLAESRPRPASTTTCRDSRRERLEAIIAELREQQPWLGESEVVTVASQKYNAELQGARERGSSEPRPLFNHDVRWYPHDKPRDITKVDMAFWLPMEHAAQHDGPWPLFLHGPVGLGKSCAALCLLDRIAGGRRYFPIEQLCEHLIAVSKGQIEYGGIVDAPQRWWRRIARLSIVVIDDIGKRSDVSDFHAETVNRMLDVREGKPTVYVSNKSIAELARLYDDRIASRLSAGVRVKFEGKDRRLQQ